MPFVPARCLVVVVVSVVDAWIALRWVLDRPAPRPGVAALSKWGLTRELQCRTACAALSAFAGSIAGVAILYVATFLRIWDAPTLGRAVAGVFITSLVAGFVYAGAGYAMRRR